ncbi:DoxX family protein [Streptomyces sp. NPDC001292]|uniref:DoxX family protein n=1 Tax=Streptomyces sp. NPDC001292 TaxID=3364558 RepID=UPI0036B01336
MMQARTWLSRLMYTSAPGAVLWIRFYVGAIFLSEGILKFVRTASLGTGRFDKVGIPAPAFFATLDGIFEIGCGCESEWKCHRGCGGCHWAVVGVWPGVIRRVVSSG